jgi:flavin-dependent dehydrogenase
VANRNLAVTSCGLLSEGGGPGGLFSAWSLAGKAGNSIKITILEASHRLGGKIVTGSFAGAGLYEAGVAEIYDYSALGPAPLRELIEQDLNLQIKHIRGGGLWHLHNGSVS